MDYFKVAIFLLNKGIEEKLQGTSLRILNLIIVEYLERIQETSSQKALMNFIPVVGSALSTIVLFAVLRNYNLKKIANKLDVEERSVARAIAELVEKKILFKEKSEDDKRVALYYISIPKDFSSNIV